MNGKDALVEALEAQQAQHMERATRELCKRLGIDYAPANEPLAFLGMWSKIGYLFASKEKEFTKKRRGRKRIPISREMQIASHFEAFRNLSDGHKFTDKEIAEQLREWKILDLHTSTLGNALSQKSRGVAQFRALTELRENEAE